jgi:RNA polymerase sigma-70 factor (ECF subfamily)
MLPRFESTIWTIIQKAKERDPDAMNEFVLKYRAPLVKFIILNGFKEEDAEDLTQDLFLKIFKEDVLQKADQKKGRFRSLLLAVTKNVIKTKRKRDRTKKRGSSSSVVSFEEIINKDSETDLILKDIITTDEKDERFDKLWIFNILEIALDRLKKESLQKDTPYYAVIDMYLRQDMDYKQIADALGKSTKEVANYIFRGRQKLMDYILNEIASYSSSQDEFKTEVAYLSSFLKRL